ncbi:uncharacterized protein JCM6883_001887 [Sporobolomyces salmoneus]|uniref:uncharacterized protein n=1 Tax=Sporobolomyces salmoneus TaxID=183962 RepID=UPI00316B9B1E
MSTSQVNTIPHQDKLLAASYSLQIKSGKGSRIDLVFKIAKERHPEAFTQLTESALKAAKTALNEHGALVHTSGPINKISEDAMKGIESWKQKQMVDAQDDEQAAAQYLARGVKPGFVETPKPSSSKSQAASKAGPSSGSPAPRQTPEVKTKVVKGKEKQASDEAEENEEEAEGGKGKKRATKAGDGSGKATKEGGKENNGSGQEIEPKKKPRRRTGPAGPGISGLKRVDLIKKIRELEETISGGKVDSDAELNDEELNENENGSDGEEDAAPLMERVMAKKKNQNVPSAQKPEAKGPDDSGELSELEEDEQEHQDQIPPKLLASRPEPPPSRFSHQVSPPSLPRHDGSPSEEGNPPITLAQLSSPETRLSLVVSGGAGGAVAGGSKVKDVNSRPSGSKITQRRREIKQAEKDGEEQDMELDDQTLVDIEVEGDDQKTPTFVKPHPVKHFAKLLQKVAPRAKSQPPTVDTKSLQELTAAKEEIVKLKSIRDELVRERNDATEDKAELRRKLEECQQQVEEMKKGGQGGTGNPLNDTKLLQADQQTITALTHDISDLETEKETLAQQLELRDADFEALSSEVTQLQTMLSQNRTLLEQVTAAKVELEYGEKANALSNTRLEESLRIAQEDLRQVEEEIKNEREEHAKEYGARGEEVQTVKNSLESLQLDLVNAAISCKIPFVDGPSAKSLVDDFKTRHLILVQRNNERERSLALARNLLEVLVPPSKDSPAPSTPPSTLEETLELLSVKVNDVVRQSHQVSKLSNEQGFIEAIADLVVASGGGHVPTTFAQLPKAIEDVKNALVDKNTSILQLQARVQAIETDLNEANLSHKTLESSLDQIQGELGATKQELERKGGKE